MRYCPVCEKKALSEPKNTCKTCKWWDGPDKYGSGECDRPDEEGKPQIATMGEGYWTFADFGCIFHEGKDD